MIDDNNLDPDINILEKENTYEPKSDPKIVDLDDRANIFKECLSFESQVKDTLIKIYGENLLQKLLTIVDKDLDYHSPDKIFKINSKKTYNNILNLIQTSIKIIKKYPNKNIIDKMYITSVVKLLEITDLANYMLFYKIIKIEEQKSYKEPIKNAIKIGKLRNTIAHIESKTRISYKKMLSESKINITDKAFKDTTTTIQTIDKITKFFKYVSNQIKEKIEKK